MFNHPPNSHQPADLRAHPTLQTSHTESGPSRRVAAANHIHRAHVFYLTQLLFRFR